MRLFFLLMYIFFGSMSCHCHVFIFIATSLDMIMLLFGNRCIDCDGTFCCYFY